MSYLAEVDLEIEGRSDPDGVTLFCNALLDTVYGARDSGIDFGERGNGYSTSADLETGEVNVLLRVEADQFSDVGERALGVIDTVLTAERVAEAGLSATVQKLRISHPHADLRIQRGIAE